MKKTKVKEIKANELAEQLNQVPVHSEENNLVGNESAGQIHSSNQNITEEVQQTNNENPGLQCDAALKAKNDAVYDRIFDRWDEKDFKPQDFVIDVPIASLESAVGYSSLLRQMNQAFIRRVAFYTSSAGGSLSREEARARAFHSCRNKEEAKELFRTLIRVPVEDLNFVDLQQLHQFAPRVAERFWERTKREAKDEFESGHLAANITFPVGYMKGLWNIARYIGVRESFIDDWKPKGGIEVALIDMMAQSYFQWQFWLEQTVKRSQTKEREEHPDYQEWQRYRKDNNEGSWADGIWLRPYVSEAKAIEQAVQMADRFNRIFMRTLRQLRDFRRYSPVTINNPNQVNIATNSGQQVNVSDLP